MDAMTFAATSVEMMRAVIRALHDDGTIEIGVNDAILDCDCIESARQATLNPGDEVLVWHNGAGERGVILGRIRSASAPVESRDARDQPPDELVIEARKNLTLKVGEGLITIREDGKILIRGRDLVSHAKRMNRIRGGSVAIN